MKKLFVILFFFTLNSFAQGQTENPLKSYFIVTFGDKNINKTNLAVNNNTNYFDYMVTNDNQQIGLQLRKSLGKNNAIKITSLLFSDLAPINFEMEYAKLKTKKLGYFVSAKTIAYNFSFYPIVKFEGEMANYNNEQSLQYGGYIHHPSINFGPMFLLNRNKLNFETKLNLGAGGMVGFNHNQLFKSEKTLKVAQVKIKGDFSPYFLVSPNFSLTYFPAIFKKYKLGINANGNMLYSKRSFNYQTKINYYTETTTTIQSFNGANTSFKNFELNLGLHWQVR